LGFRTKLCNLNCELELKAVNMKFQFSHAIREELKVCYFVDT